MTTQARILAAFAHGYSEEGTFPMPPRAIVECQIIEGTGALIIEAGRTEGRRAKRHRAHVKLYAGHAAELSAAIGTILARIDTAALVPRIVALAAQNAGATPVERRASVATHVRAVIDGHATGQDLAAIHAVNASGWAHATAYGTAEAESTPARGGPPNAAKVAAAATAALAAVSHDEAVASTVEWSTAQLDTVAMGVALAAGDGSALGEATRKVTAALVNTGRATRTYADQLHRTVMQSFVASTQAATPGVLYDWVNGGADPCDDCIEDALESPYAEDELPDYPEHMGCLCDIELASKALANA